MFKKSRPWLAGWRDRSRANRKPANVAPKHRPISFHIAPFRAEPLEARLFLSTTPTLLYPFKTSIAPVSITVDSAGNLYGTSNSGGANDFGSIWELVKGSKTVTTLYSFTDGFMPDGIAVDSNGNLFGTTELGGDFGDGVVYELAKGATNINVLVSFPFGEAVPQGIAVDASDNLFGVAAEGGTYNNGSIWEIVHNSGEVTTLYSFTADSEPYGFAMDSAGDFFGTNQFGATGTGTVWELAKGATVATTLYTIPVADVPESIAVDASGNLFFDERSETSDVIGSVLELARGSNTPTTIWSFAGGANGGSPYGITVDPSGNAYVTTVAGGVYLDGTIVEFPGASSTLPSAPINLTAVQANVQVTLTWSAVTGATSYDIYRSTTAGGEGLTPYKTGITTISYVDTGLTNGITYYYQVAAISAVGHGSISAEASATPSAWQIITPGGQTGDFNHDGISDILLENTTTGQIGTFLVHTGSAPTWVNMGTIPTGWAVTFLGDFTGNGTTDLLLQNAATGQFGTWLISAGSVTSWSNLGTVPAGWAIEKVGDFTGTGTDDLLLQNAATGQMGIWIISAAHITTWKNLGSLPTAWQIQNPADLTGNGIQDVVLWNQTTGALGAWLLNSSAAITSFDDITTLAPTTYQLILGDFNGDGTTDIGVEITGQNLIGAWFITDGAITGSFHAMATVPPDWAFTAVGDFNSDATTDLLLQNSNDQFGSWLVTLSSGNPVVTWDSLGTL